MSVYQVKRCHSDNTVEAMGLEPTTSTLQRSHSSQLSYAPEGCTAVPAGPVNRSSTVLRADPTRAS